MPISHLLKLTPKNTDKLILDTLPERIASNTMPLCSPSKMTRNNLPWKTLMTCRPSISCKNRSAQTLQTVRCNKRKYPAGSRKLPRQSRRRTFRRYCGAKEQDLEKEVSEEDISEDSPIAKTVNLILEYAIRSNASDIHIEPREGNSASTLSC